MTTTPDFRALGAKIVELWDANCDIDVEINELRELLATPLGPPKNCWLDDEDDLCPSPCVFDDPSEVISNCIFAETVKCKTDCKYYRAATPPPKPPTDEEIEEAAKLIHASMRFAVPDNHYTRDWVERGNSLMQDEARRTARVVLERWGRA
jgi:hypothetical protein